jgi:hypothetical protein
MSSHLEQFIRDHREEFDGDEPAQKVWEAIDQEMGTDKRVKTPLIRFGFLRWGIAAAMIIGVATGIWYFAGNQKKMNGNSLALKTDLPSTAKPKQKEVQPISPDNSLKTTGTQKDSVSPETATNQSPVAEEGDDIYKEELYHFAKLVEIKHKELKKIERDEPLLYKQFSGDVSKLDSVYHSLGEQLTKNPNQEQLLEAMIQNLQLQMRLLNHQLDIIKQINHSKKSEYENAYKSI